MCTKASILHFVTECKDRKQQLICPLYGSRTSLKLLACSEHVSEDPSAACVCWQVVWRHDQCAADRQTDRRTGSPAGALWIANLGPSLESASIIALSLLFHPLFPKLYWTPNHINLKARASSFIQYKIKQWLSAHTDLRSLIKIFTLSS